LEVSKWQDPAGKGSVLVAGFRVEALRLAIRSTQKKRYNAAMQNNTSPTVMVVDDYDDVRVILKRWLEEGGYRSNWWKRGGGDGRARASRTHSDGSGAARD